MEKNNMNVIVLDNEHVKIKDIKNVKAIIIKDKNYNLLMMYNYWPLLGELNGSITVESDETYSFENIKGFYTLSHNVFRLIILGETEENDK